MQSAYDFAIINNWDGTSEVEDGVIMSSVIAAGKTGTNGTFSGIIMGEAFGGEANDENAKSDSVLGLYGVSNGSISFSMTENGLATF
jgi:fructose-specific phosphotransferase system IIC component